MRVAALALAAWAAALPAAAERLVLVIPRAFDGSGWHEDVAVTIDGGRIASVTSADHAPRNGRRIDAPAGSVLTPGLLDLDADLGLSRGRDEAHEALSPDLRVADGFAPTPEEADAFLRSGVTTAWLAPGPLGVLGGAGALVRPDASGPELAHAAWGLAGSLAAQARVPGRAPTSLPEQARMLRDALDAAGSVSRVRIRVDDAASARLAAGMPGAVLVARPAAGPDLVEMGEAAAVVVSGLGPWDSDAHVEAIVGLARAGVAIAFGSGEHPAGSRAVRHAAFRAVAAGLDADAAMAALTATAARIAGLHDGTGTLASGAPADLVLWSGDPLALQSRPLRTWVAGREVHHAP